MLSLKRFVITFILLVKTFDDFIALSSGQESNKPGPATAGNYSWDTEHACGFINRTQSRIRNGTFAEIEEFPWMASMFVYLRPKNARPRLNFLCSAAIISDYWLITAKHCITKLTVDPRAITFFVGLKYTHDYIDRYDYAAHVSAYGSDIYPLLDIDVALVRVKRKILPRFTKNGDKYRVNKVCLPVPNVFNDKQEEAVLSGHGLIDADATKQPWILRKAKYVIESVAECKKRVPHTSEDHICAFTDEHITCHGDSGAPLIQFDGNRAVLIGIVSNHGPDPTKCDKGWVRFTRISMFALWINNIIKSDNPVDWVPPPPPPMVTIPAQPAVKSLSPNPLLDSTTPQNDANRLTYKTISVIIPMVLFINIFM